MLEMTNITFSNLEAYENGGIYLQYSANTTIFDTIFTDCVSLHGSGLYSLKSPVKISNTIF